MLCEPVAEAPVVKFSKALLRELAETFDCECSLLYLSTPDGFGLVARDRGHELTDFAKDEIGQGIRSVLETKIPAAYLVRASDPPISRYQSIVFAPLYASMLGLLRMGEEILGVVYLDRRLVKGFYTEENLGHLGQLLQARTSSLAQLLKEEPDFAHLGLLSPDLREAD